MAEAQQMTDEELAAEYNKSVDFGPGPTPDEEPPSFEQFSKDRAEGKIDGHEKPRPAPPATRDQKGRFAAVAERLARTERKQHYLNALDSGAVDPEESLSPEEWARAREGQIRNRTVGIAAPELHAEKTEASDKAESATAQQELSPEAVKHIEAHESLMGTIAAKSAIDPEMREALNGVRTAIEQGSSPQAVAVLGHFLADLENGDAVFRVLGANPDAIMRFSNLPPQGMQLAIRKLSEEVAAHKQPAPKPPKPAPPAPVGARASVTAFDVNDEKTDIEEWARQRNKQVAERRRRQ